jgi:hypothetical protein
LAFNIDLATLAKQHFGIDLKYTSFNLEDISDIKPPNNYIPFGNVEALEGGDTMVNGVPVDRYSAMGTPIFDYIKIKPGNYYNFDGELTPIRAYDFPFECIVELSQPSMIEETFIVGRKGGSIKEQMGVDDWYITIRGFIINYDSLDYPTDAVLAFKELISHPAELEVESPWLNMFDINEIVIFDRNIPQLEGTLHYQPFTLLAKSNEPFTVEV